MALKVQGTSVVNDSRELQNISSLDVTTTSTITAAINPLDSADVTAIAGETYFSSSDDATFASVTVTGSVIVGGNLQVTGTTTTVNSEDLLVTDNMIYMNAGESDGSPTLSIDVGWAANVNDDGSYQHVGMFRDATDNTFKVFQGYTPEPDAAVEINTGHASFDLAPFAAKTLTGQYQGFDSDLNAASIKDLSDVYSSMSPSDGQVLTYDTTNGWQAETPSAGYTNSDVDTHLNTSTASTNEVLSWTGSDYDWVAQSSGGISNVVEDTTPQLGGDLDTNGNQIHGGTAQYDAVYISGAYGANDGNVWLSGVTNGGTGGTVNVNGTNGGTGGTVKINYGGNNGQAYGTTYIGSIASVAGFDNAVHIVNSQWPQSRGSNGQVLSTNGSGTLSWVNNGGGLSVLSTKTLDNPTAYGSSASDQFGYSVAISGNYAIVGAQFEDDGGSNSGKAYIFDVPSGSLLYTLDNPNAYNTSSSDLFGISVAISGNHAIVGAIGEDDAGGTSSGKAYIYDISGFSSSTISSADYVLDNPNAYSTSSGDEFGRSVAISGNYAIVGANFEDDAGGTASGKAYIYDISTFTSSTISSATYVLNNPNAYSTSAEDYFGISVAISGNYAIVGAYLEDDAGGSNSGKAYIYDISTFTSSTISSANYTLNNPNAYSTSASDQFGYSVAISGNYAIVGAQFEDDAGGTASGKAYIYDISGFSSSTISSATYVLDNPNAYSTSANDNFGYSVAISGNYAIVGVSGEDDAGGSGSGKAYIYDISTFTSSTISSATYVLDNPNAYSTSAGDQFGFSVAISGNYAIVGARFEDDAGGTSSGKAYIFKTNGEAYTYTPQEIASFAPTPSSLGVVNIAAINEKVDVDTTTSGTLTIDLDATDGRVVWLINNQTANRSLDLDNWDFTNSLSGNSFTVSVLFTNGSTAYGITQFTADGGLYTVKWAGGSSPTPNANSVDLYTFTIMRNGFNTLVLGNMVNFS